MGLGLGGSLPTRPAVGADPVSAGLRLVLAAVLLAIGARALHREGLTASTAPGGQSLARSFGLGIALMAGNLTSLVVLVSLVTLVPSLLPPLVLVLTGAWGRARLEQLRHWTLDHEGQINGGLCFLFAAYLGWSGVARL